MPGRAKVNGLIVRVSGVLAVGRSGDQFARGGDRWPLTLNPNPNPNPGPVINLPEVAIAGLGKTRPSPRYDASGNLVKMSMMQVNRVDLI